MAYRVNVDPAFDVLAFGAVGDGATNDTAAIRACYAAAGVAGGQVRFPAGTFLTSGLVSITLPAGGNITTVGAGMDATVLLVSDASGYNVAFGDTRSSFGFRDLTFATDQIGLFTALNCHLDSGIAVDGSNQFGPFNLLENVSFRGSDFDAAGANYWQKGFVETGVSNINITGGGYNGPVGSDLGIGYQLAGALATSIYSVGVNFRDVTINNCATCVSYGDFLQNVTIDGCNFPSCSFAVSTVTSSTGSPSGLSMTNNFIAATGIGVSINDVTFQNCQLSNNNFQIPANGFGVKLGGADFTVVGNAFVAASQTGTVGVFVAAASGYGGLIAANSFANTAMAIHVNAAVASPVNIKMNMFTNTVEPDYVIDGGATGILIDDDVPRNFAQIPTSVAGIIYSRFLVADLAVSTYNAAVTTGGGSTHGFVLSLGAGGYVLR